MFLDCKIQVFCRNLETPQGIQWDTNQRLCELFYQTSQADSQISMEDIMYENKEEDVEQQLSYSNSYYVSGADLRTLHVFTHLILLMIKCRNCQYNCFSDHVYQNSTERSSNLPKIVNNKISNTQLVNSK